MKKITQEIIKQEPTQKELNQFVKNNVIACQSCLIDHLLLKEIFNYDDIVNLCNDKECDNCGESTEDCECEDYQPKVNEIFEWWLCETWLINRLEELGEPILKTDFGSWWGRTTTGQALLLDHVIKVIYTQNQ
jgi:hypothetical protein